MAGRKPHEAVTNYLEPLRKAISCITRSGLQVTSRDQLNKVHALTLNRGSAVPLRGRRDLTLNIRQGYRIEEAEGELGPYEVSTAAYAYIIGDAEEREILTYHWHPEGPSHITEPHLHLGPAAEIGCEELVKAHIPVGRITIEDVIGLLLRDFGVKPLREDWEDVLAETQGKYENYRTTSGRGPTRKR